ncbi:MAG TPA: VWA domain-containing protein [Gemmatimonadales bacterium]|nr:VWA domain-containing protein [Gemmatimonadales bacterium]
MAEPEDVIAEAVYAATTTARALWLRHAGPDERPRLAELRHRLGLFVTMLFPDAPELGVAQPPAPRTLLARWATGTPPHATAEALASTDGARLRLPSELPGIGPEAVLPTYRLLALEQAARAARGTPALLPAGDPLLRDLYLLAEAAAVDRDLVSLVPRLAPQIAAARSAERARRPDRRLTGPEQAVERLLRLVLEAPPATPPDELGVGATAGGSSFIGAAAEGTASGGGASGGAASGGTASGGTASGGTASGRTAPRDSLAWARAEAARIRALGGRYRGLRPVPLWGAAAAAAEGTPGSTGAAAAEPGQDRRAEVGRMVRRPRVRPASPDEDDARQGMWLPRADDPKESVEDPMGLQRPADRDTDGRPGDLGDSLSELPEARLVRTPDPVREILISEEAPPRLPAPGAPEPAGGALIYPEWDWRAGRYRLRGAVVHQQPAPEGHPDWTQGALRLHRARIRRVRREFERLRPRRRTLRQQAEGADLDLDAYVVSAADRRAGAAPEERLYLDQRRVSRDAAVLLLADVSASTDSWVAGTRRVIDVAREALLIVAEALAALGERHAILAFRSQGAARVDLLAVKQFSDRPGAAVRRRIGGLEPDGYTRLGAALRHATALLAGEPVRQRILLLLSDGRPNDLDVYEGRYGLEDTRRAMAEARLQGIRPFCLTIDREAPQYAGRVFGPGGHALLRHPERLPEVLVAVLRQLLRDSG